MILVPKQDLPAGTKIDVVTMFETKLFPKSDLPVNVVNDHAKLQGRRLERLVVAYLPVTERDFTGVVPLPPDPGYVAVTVRAFPEFFGMVLPEARVDLIGVVVDPKDRQRLMSQVLESHLKLLAVNVRAEQAEGDPAPVMLFTLMVKPEQEKRILIAQQQGKLAITPHRPE